MIPIAYIIYGAQKLNIQMLISLELLGQISSNFHSFGRIRVLHADKVGCQSEFGNPLFLACENGQKFYTFVYIVSWLSLWFSRFGEILLSFFFFGLPCGLARPLIVVIEWFCTCVMVIVIDMLVWSRPGG